MKESCLVYMNELRKLGLLMCLMVLSISAWAQPSNDDCASAINIPSVDEYCSAEMEFTNVGATPDVGLEETGTQTGCFANHDNGVWFTFTPFLPAVRINVFTGLDDALGFDIMMTVYRGNCNNLEFVQCSPGAISDVEWLLNGLTLGETYYLLIESTGIESAFQLCIDEFFSPPSPESDCPEAVVLCDKTGFSVANLADVGNIPDELEGPCVTDPRQAAEEASAWYTWTCEESGSLTFTITPTNPIDPEEDIDFILYRLPNGLGDCDNREAVRCMFSGETRGSDGNDPCFGPTGLAEGETDTEEFAGCSPGDNNFLAPLDMIAGESYALIINNFSRSGFGFDLEFGGTGEFRGPQLDYDFMTLGNVIECDKIVEFIDASTSDTDPIESIVWNFGKDAVPPTRTGIGPHTIVYSSFGLKSISLVVETTRGCLVNEVFEVDVAPCCFDLFPNFDVLVDASTKVCPGESNGEITVEGINGSPEYLFTVNGPDTNIELSPNTIYNDLGPGTYTVDIVDTKGCMSAGTVTIEETDPVFVNAGLDLEIELGFLDTLNATVDPPGANVTYAWSPEEGLDCEGSDFVDCPDPIVVAPGNTTYTVTITDENGCTAEDAVIVRTLIVRPIYAPNATLINSPLGEDIFKLGFGRQAKMVSTFIIYDRWGNPIFEGRDIALDERNEMVTGWDGRFGGSSNGGTKFVGPGVYVWFAEVLFIDDVTLPYAGDVTVIR